MGKSKANYATLGLSGKVGKIFVYRQQGGETIVAPPYRRKNMRVSEKNLSVPQRYSTETYHHTIHTLR